MTRILKISAACAVAGLLSACNPVGTAVGAATNVATGVVTTTASTAVGIVL
ncbi:hypothetical protein [Flavimaricola marinus]|uniref:Lipoprotein n=1 Tax=Flavimaricola marinus TaxID=1819565 RepID=A0A238LCN2_9RHOB|nr:hypothetical protein [Flavimaricola marinus]SMY07449.1 hypothetical protein LOM8899_01584 [Flavimaricola marinus]